MGRKESNQTNKQNPVIVGPNLVYKASYFSTKTYVVATQKNRLNETVNTILLSTQTNI